jgi:UDP-N-acetylglucosamine 2-epimerase (non-hydrolysing)
MIKIAIVVGTRPNFIKITQFEKEFEKYPGVFNYKLIHTGQHYDKNMSDLFFDQFKLKKPNVFLNIGKLKPAHQIAEIINGLSRFFDEWKPDLVIVPGDVNSTLAAAIAANKTGSPLAHLESGLRSFDRSMPEEHNRVITDWLADYLFVTEKSGLINLQKEGKPDNSIYFVGNTMIDTLVAYNDQIESSDILKKLGIEHKHYALMTMHRPSNVDNKESLSILNEIVQTIIKEHQLVFPIHPRTIKNLQKFGLLKHIENNKQIILCDPLDYFSFQKLTASTSYVVTDSGGIQEETTFRQIPCLTLRKNTERPITITKGTNKLVPYNIESIREEITHIQNGNAKNGDIPELWDGKSTSRIVKILSELK